MTTKKEERKTVYVALSGGVDSAVSAGLLKKAGYSVVGAFIKVWQAPFLECDWRRERHDAMRVAAHLDIPFETVDLSEDYKREVVDYMIAEYAAGRTPNPDVVCNRAVKFGAFWRAAREQGADMIATGHYARVLLSAGEARRELLAGADANKDQSYFLWTLTQDDLEHALFPVGDREKALVRSMAGDFGLSVADKKDSQGVCFLGEISMRDFLKHFIETAPGAVLNEKDETIGRHDGALLYTLGQRHGFEVTKKTPESGAHYVVSKDVSANTITVAEGKERGNANVAARQTRIVLEKVNWISGEPPNASTHLSARVRYRQPLQSTTIEAATDNSATVVFDKPQIVPAGQSVVFYDGDVCLGGGIIK